MSRRRGLTIPAFTVHRSNARARGIEFLLTYQEWVEVWESSGHADEKGRYVMARFGDTGPYAVGNVKIITNSENAREAAHPSPSQEIRDKIAAKLRGQPGHPMSESNRQALIKANKGRLLTVEHRRKLSLAKQGVPAGLLKRQRISASIKRWWALRKAMEV